MVFGIGTDIIEVNRFMKYISNQNLIDRFFNKEEQKYFSTEQAACEHYAARFAAKEAFSKALGTGLVGFDFTDVYIRNSSSGKPELVIVDSARKKVEEVCGDFSKCSFLVSISHEKMFATANVIIEIN